MYKFLLVDDHNIVRTGLKFVLSNHYTNAQFFEAENCDEALNLLKNNNFDLLVLDINIPGSDSANFITNILITNKNARILIFSMHKEEVFAKPYFKMGVKGYLNKELANPHEIRKAVEEILRGKVYMSTQLLRQFSVEAINGNKVSLNPFNNLSNREAEITIQLIQGNGISEIANSLNLHTSTIGTHKARIFTKLNVNNIVELLKLSKLYNYPSNIE